MTKDKGQLICCICNKPIPVKGTWNLGNNAEPVANGRCCDDCNNNVVIPARVKEMYIRQGLTREEATKAADGVRTALSALVEKTKNEAPE